MRNHYKRKIMYHFKLQSDSHYHHHQGRSHLQNSSPRNKQVSQAFNFLHVMLIILHRIQIKIISPLKWTIGLQVLAGWWLIFPLFSHYRTLNRWLVVQTSSQSHLKQLAINMQHRIMLPPRTIKDLLCRACHRVSSRNLANLISWYGLPRILDPRLHFLDFKLAMRHSCHIKTEQSDSHC